MELTTYDNKPVVEYIKYINGQVILKGRCKEWEKKL